MSAKPDGGPAFAVSASMRGEAWDGMTLRQWYAGKYMQGASASGEAYEWAGLAEDSFRLPTP